MARSGRGAGPSSPGKGGVASPTRSGASAQSLRGPANDGSASVAHQGPGQPALGPKTITGAVNSGTAARIRITSANHGFSDLDTVTIASVVGTTEANGRWQILLVTASTFDLIGSTFSNAYVSGGTATRASSV